MLSRRFSRGRFRDSNSRWIRSLALDEVKCLIVCRGPVRKEAIDVFEEMGIREYGMLLSEKDSIVYPKCVAPELRDFRFPYNVHRVPDYMGHTAEERQDRMHEIVRIALENHYTHLFSGYGFMAEDPEFLQAVEEAGLTLVGPGSQVARRAGAKDEAKKLARSLGASVTPGVDNVSALALLRQAGDGESLKELARRRDLPFRYDEGMSLEDNAEALLQSGYGRDFDLVTVDDLKREAETSCEEIWRQHPGRRIRFKYIGGGGGKGQRVIEKASDVAGAVMEVCAESKVLTPGSNRNFLIELNIESTRHNEIQLIGNGDWCLSLGGRDCSVQMHEQKLLEVSLTRELLEKEIALSRESNPKRAEILEVDARVLAEMEEEAERFGAAVGLDSVSTFESIVEGSHHYFMEMNTRIQVEHRVTEMAYHLKFCNPDHGSDFFYVDSLIEAMVLLSAHGSALPRPEREVRHVAGAEVRINATNLSLQPHAGGLIYYWSPPTKDELRDDQGIGTIISDTGSFTFYNVAGAYDSNIALVVTHGEDRRDTLERLWEILRRTRLRGYELHTNLSVHYGLLGWILGSDPMMKPSTQFMNAYLAGIGSLEQIVRDFDLEFAWQQILEQHPQAEARDTLHRKRTLLLRPIEEFFSNSHLLGGFIGRYGGELWREQDGDFVFARNPIHFLRDLYHYLHLEANPSNPPCEQIWDHDDEILTAALAFYEEIGQRADCADDWSAMQRLIAGRRDDRVAADDGFWTRCVAAHNGYQIGLDLLLMIPRLGKASGFLGIHVDERLELVFPEHYTAPETRNELIRYLSPAPQASADEIVAPMGGHFYASEAPDLPPMIEEGQHFEKGQPLFIIEVMKMFNKVPAPCSGTIRRELQRNCDGKVVIKGQPIFKIIPDEIVEEESEEVIARRRQSVTKRLMGLPA